MKIRTQLIASIALFVIALLIIAASVVVTNQQVDRLNHQEDLVNSIEIGAGELGYLSNDYLLYHESQQLDRWNEKYNSFSGDLANLTVDQPEQQVLVNNIKANQERLKDVFTDVASTIESPDRSDTIDPAFIQLSWSRLAVQTRGISFDASRLSRMLLDEEYQVRQTSTLLIIALMGTFALFLLVDYLLIFGRTIKSISFLQAGTRIVGSGDLNYSIKALKNDEVGELAKSFNMMTARLKTVTASKAELEREIIERKQVEAEKETTAEFLRLVNESRNIRDMIRAATAFLKEKSGCEAVGIRLREGDDYPYYETRGFSDEFVRAESQLCTRDGAGLPVCDSDGYPIHECMCGNVIHRRFDPSKPFFTARGSFWANNTTKLLATTTEEDRQARTRNRCNGEGYESVAVIAIRTGSECLGTLQLNDRRIGRFTPETIALWERISDYLAVALAKFRAEDELRRSEASLAKSQEMAHIGSWEMDVRTGDIRRSDESYRIFGLAPGEGKINFEMFLKFIVPQDRGRVEETIKSSMKTGLPYDIVYRIKRKDGEARILHSEGVMGKDASGAVVRTFGTNQDITERKQADEALKQSEEKYRVVADNTFDWEFWLSPAGQFKYISPSCERITGYPAAEFIRNPDLVFDIIYPDDVAAYRKHYNDDVKRKTAAEMEYRIIRRNGDMRWIHHVCHPIFDGDGHFIGTRGSNRDVTLRKETEEALKEAKMQAELYLDLMGHDISNMHQIILGQLELAQEMMDMEGKLGSEDREMIDTSVATLQRSARLIDNIRNIQKLRTGEYKFVRMDLGDVLDEAVTGYSRLPDRDIAISYAPVQGFYVTANPLLKDIFNNLIDNAVKHCDDPVRISVSVDPVDRDGRRFYEVCIEDNGHGVPDDKKADIFNRLKRGDTKARGTGLGLYIVKTLAESFGGSVRVEDRIRGDHTKGARFIVSLPAAGGNSDA